MNDTLNVILDKVYTLIQIIINIWNALTGIFK